MTENAYALILVYSTSHALRAEKILEQAGIDCKLIPVPRRISSDCGICVRVRQSDEDRAAYLLESSGLEVAGIHQVS